MRKGVEKLDKKAIFVLVIALFLLIFKLNATGALTDPSSTINYGQLFYDDDDYDETLDDMNEALCDSIVFGGGDCFVTGICGGISSEGSTEDLGNIEDTEGILVTFDDEGNMIVGAQLSAGRSPPIRTFDEETGEEKWIRYYKIEYELRDRADGQDTTYSIGLYDAAVAGANLLFTPILLKNY